MVSVILDYEWIDSRNTCFHFLWIVNFGQFLKQWSMLFLMWNNLSFHILVLQVLMPAHYATDLETIMLSISSLVTCFLERSDSWRNLFIEIGQVEVGFFFWSDGFYHLLAYFYYMLLLMWATVRSVQSVGGFIRKFDCYLVVLQLSWDGTYDIGQL